MTVRYVRDDARRRIVVTMQGPFALPDFLGVIERQQVDHTWAYGVLYDLRGMTGQPTAADLRQSTSLAAQADGPRGRVALVTGDPAMYRRACAYAALGRSFMDDGGVSRCGRGQSLAGRDEPLTHLFS